MRPVKLSVMLVLCMTVALVSGCAKEKVKQVSSKSAPVVKEEVPASKEGTVFAQEEKKPIATETISLQNKTPDPNEPSILELQRAAIKYAEVSPDKIVNLRRLAALKALMPEISVGYDTDIYRTISTATSNGRTNFFIGPDDEARGWDVSASWDLGDLVYNTAQTSIDSRSKLMVELRNDIMEALNTAYFERKKLQKQLIRITDKESPSYTERELRIEELTATIDGLTGGYLSRKLEKE
ncbi:MAG: hypothetical protein PHO67_03110 [Candidatus Omnitrophica bacterium]|nr:hypothetical protein [Candidatus Omnitrophota bacterium]MDD5546138.1 hypothetical protein [Candidatus Omnitrophota bacterium]